MYIVHFDTGRSWRGGQNQVYILMQGLKGYDVKQLLITPKNSPLQEKAEEIGIAVKNLDPKNDIDFISGFKLRKIIKQESPDVIHYHTAKSLGVGHFALKSLPVKKVVTRRVDLPVSKAKYKSVDAIVAISGFIEAYLSGLGFEHVTRIYSAVNLDRFKLKDENKSDDCINIGMAGAFDLRHKDFITFIMVAKHIIQNCADRKFKFFIAGSGKDEDKIKGMITRLELEEHIKMRGFVESIEGFLSEMDIYVHTVNFEGLGTAILQAMAVGVPVVATDVGGIPDIIEDGKNGFLVKKQDCIEAAVKVVELIENADKRTLFSKAGRELIEYKFSRNKMAKDYFELYEKLCRK
jgi:glycosyltransferase involved in cell wall biosynthesis